MTNLKDESFNILAHPCAPCLFSPSSPPETLLLDLRARAMPDSPLLESGEAVHHHGVQEEVGQHHADLPPVHQHHLESVVGLES